MSRPIPVIIFTATFFYFHDSSLQVVCTPLNDFTHPDLSLSYGEYGQLFPRFFVTHIRQT